MSESQISVALALAIIGTVLSLISAIAQHARRISPLHFDALSKAALYLAAAFMLALVSVLLAAVVAGIQKA